MKRLYSILGLTALAVISSCSIKEEIAVTEQRYPTFYGILEPAAGGMATKAYVDDRAFGFWNENDNLSIFYKDTENKKYYYYGLDGTTSGSFKPVAGEDGFNGGVPIATGLNYAIYPYHDFNSCQEEDGTLIIPFPKERTISAFPDGMGASIMLVAKSETTKLPFKHVAGYLGFNLYGNNVSVASITLTSKNNEPFSGYADVVYGEGDQLQVTFTNRGKKDDPSCTFYYDPPIALGGSPDEAKLFWITLPPTVLSNGLTLTVKDANGGVWNRESSFSNIKVNTFQEFDPLEVLPVITVTGVEVKPASLEMAVGDTETLTATVAPSNAPNQAVTWSSSDSNVATVENGVVTAIAPGTATITVTTAEGGKTATCAVTVKNVVTYDIILSPATTEEPTVFIGKTLAFTLTLITTTNGNAVESDITADATWTSSDENTATVAAGISAGVKKGTVTITAKYTPVDAGELSASAELKVTEEPNHAGGPTPVGEEEEL